MDRFALGCVTAVAVAAVLAPTLLILTGHRDDVVTLAPAVSPVLAAVVVAMGQQIHRTAKATQRAVGRIEQALNGALPPEPELE